MAVEDYPSWGYSPTVNSPMPKLRQLLPYSQISLAHVGVPRIVKSPMLGIYIRKKSG